MKDSDLQLLENYTRNNSQDSFTALVNRHLNLVFPAALRQVRSPQLAEDVAQSVFSDLAQNATRLKRDTILPAWLYEVTRRTAIDVVRRESRRQLREKVAHELTAMNATADDWKDIEPFLDEAMHALDETDRAAVLLRYFENKSLREVGETLGTSDDAAQKRVSRAVERLREFFTKRGVTIGASGLVIVISANAVQAAPIGLAVTISTAVALAGTSIVATTATLTKTIAMTTIQKTLIAATLVAAVGTGIFEIQKNFRLQNQVQKFQQQQMLLTGQMQQLQRERDKTSQQLAELLSENERLKSNPNEKELLKLRGEVARLRLESQQNSRKEVKEASDPDQLAAQAWVARVKLLRQRFEQWPGKTTPELQLLNEQDWLNEVANRKLENDGTIRQAMADLRYTAKGKFAGAVNQALNAFTSSNNGQLPSDLSQLTPYLKPPADSRPVTKLQNRDGFIPHCQGRQTPKISKHGRWL